MTPTEREVMNRALDALEQQAAYFESRNAAAFTERDAIEALRTALAEPSEPASSVDHASYARGVADVLRKQQEALDAEPKWEQKPEPSVDPANAYESYLDHQDFYDDMQAYRHARHDPAQEVERIKTLIKFNYTTRNSSEAHIAAPQAKLDAAVKAMTQCYQMLLSEPDTKGALFKAENILRESLAEIEVVK